MAQIITQTKKLSRKHSINPKNATLLPKASTTNFLLNYSKSLQTKSTFLVTMN